jgi:heptosyltransferase-2
VNRIDVGKIERVIVRGVNWVGDAAMTVPALRELRRVVPRAHVTLLTRKWARDVFADVDFIDEILILEKESGIKNMNAQIRQLRARAFDLAVLFPNSFAPAFLMFAARVPIRIGYKTSGRGFLLSHAVEVPAWKNSRHEIFYYLNIIAALEKSLTGAAQIPTSVENLTDAMRPRGELSVSASRRQEARAILCSHGARFDKTLVALCPGSTNSRAKRWQTASFAKLADLLSEQANAEIILIGAKEEADVSREVAAQMRHKPVFLTGVTNLAESIAVLSVCDLFIGNDTGPAHIAAALRLPTMVIFGPTNPQTTRPFSETAEIIRRPPACAPCMLRDCPIDHRCMTAIAPEEVFARATKILENAKVRRHSIADCGLRISPKSQIPSPKSSDF